MTGPPNNWEPAYNQYNQFNRTAASQCSSLAPGQPSTAGGLSECQGGAGPSGEPPAFVPVAAAAAAAGRGPHASQPPAAPRTSWFGVGTAGAAAETTATLSGSGSRSLVDSDLGPLPDPDLAAIPALIQTLLGAAPAAAQPAGPMYRPPPLPYSTEHQLEFAAPLSSCTEPAQQLPQVPWETLAGGPAAAGGGPGGGGCPARCDSGQLSIGSGPRISSAGRQCSMQADKSPASAAPLPEPHCAGHMNGQQGQPLPPPPQQGQQRQQQQGPQQQQGEQQQGQQQGPQQSPPQQQPPKQRSKQAEAQKRYLARQKQKAQQMEEQIKLLAQELAATKLANEGACQKEACYQLMLQYKDEMLSVLECGSQVQGPPGTQLTPETLAFLQEFNAGGVLTPEVVLRYAPDGYTANQDAQGLPISAPPFERVLADYSSIVTQFQEILTAAEARGQQMEVEQEGATGTAGTAAAHPPPEVSVESLWEADLPPWRHFLVGGDEEEAGQQAQQQAGEQGDGASGGQCPALASPAAALVEDLARAGNGDSSGSIGSGGSAASAGSSSGNGGSALSDFSAGSVTARSLQAFLEEANLHSAGCHAVHPQGFVVESAGRRYLFIWEELKSVAVLIWRMGALCWQQAILFPENMMRVFTCRMDTGEAVDGGQDEAHWEIVMAGLALRPEQMRLLVRQLEDYQAAVEATATRRREVTAMLAQVQASMDAAMAGGLTQEISALGLAAREQAAALERCVREEHAAEVKFAIDMFRLLHFPLQWSQVAVLSWPYFPKPVTMANIAGRLLWEQDILNG